MTKEEAINRIGDLRMYCSAQNWGDEYKQACDLAISALKMVEIWSGHHGQVVAPIGTFDEIYNNVEEGDDDV